METGSIACLPTQLTTPVSITSRVGTEVSVPRLGVGQVTIS